MEKRFFLDVKLRFQWDDRQRGISYVIRKLFTNFIRTYFFEPTCTARADIGDTETP